MNSSSFPRQHVDSHPNRRDFLQALGATAAGFATSEFATAVSAGPNLLSTHIKPAKNLIFLHLSGGPSQIDTFDPKPLASSEYRNFDAACQTSLPGVLISENLPRLATQLHQVSLIRTLHHDGPATHKMGHNLFQSGDLPSHADVLPAGSFAPAFLTSQALREDSVILGQRQGGASAGRIDSSKIRAGADSDDVALVHGAEISGLEAMSTRGRDRISTTYGSSELGLNCWLARTLLERGMRQVTIQQFSTVYDQSTWDMHANGGRLNSTHDDYRQILCPQLDMALSALLNDLRDTGLIEETIVVAVGEMGRTPQINAYGGRDHHTGVWTGLITGGPIRNGQVIGSSDATASESVDRPVTIAEFNATICNAMGGSTGLGMSDRSGLRSSVRPISELLS
jgi:hypothetical protein